MIDQSVRSAHFLSLSGSVNDARQTRPHFNAFLHFYSPVVVTLHSKLQLPSAHQQQHQDPVYSPFMQGRCDELFELRCIASPAATPQIFPPFALGVKWCCEPE